MPALMLEIQQAMARLPGIQENAQREIEALGDIQKLRTGALLIRLIKDIQDVPPFMQKCVDDLKKEVEELKEL